jgi:signal transduction histidine kinase/ligand-binding sensor domain-containing protein
MPLHRIVIFCCTIVVAMAAQAAPRVESVEMLFRNWTTRDGLPDNRVRDVTKTRNGFIWVATDGGLARFDGANFKIFGLQEGLLAPIVLSLLEMDNDELWAATLGGGVSVLRDHGIVRTYTTDDGLPSNWVSLINKDANGGINVFSRGKGAHLQNGRFVPTETGYVSFPQRDAAGNVWGIRNGQLRKFDRGAWRPDSSGGPQSASALCLDPRGNLWVCGEGRLWTHDAGAWQSRELPDGTTRPPGLMVAAPDGTIWIAYHRRGLYGFRNGRFIAPAATSDYVPDLVEKVIITRDGQIWLTSSNGFFSMSELKIQSATVDDSSAPRAANDLGGLVEGAPGEFILATQGSGFYRWKEGHAERVSSDRELCGGMYGNVILRAGNGSIWLGSGTGLFEMRADGTIVPHPLPGAANKEVWALTETAGGIWVGTGFGELYLLAKNEFTRIPHDGGRESIKAILAEPDGTLWLGTRGNGLLRRKDGVWTRFGRESGLLSEVIRCLYLDPAGRLWVGSDGGGLALFRGDRFISATTREGLPSDSISQMILGADGRLWLGTHNGLAVLNSDVLQEMETHKPHDLHPLLINRSDGVPSDVFTIVPPWITSDGRYAFATLHGFIRLRPEDFLPDQNRPPVFIESIMANGNTMSANHEKITLPPGTGGLQIEFSGLFFDDPDRLRFRNRLVGLEQEWNHTGALRSAVYRNLEPGSYRFEVEASTGNGLWSERPAIVGVEITPYFWETTWFKISGVILSVGVVAWIVRARERRHSRRRIEVLERRQAVDAERARIARDLHDDVGSGLTQMALRSQLVERNLTKNPARAVNHLNVIFSTAEGMTRALDEIIWAVNPSHDTLANFISFLASFTQNYAEGAGLRCRFDVSDSMPQISMPQTVRHHLYLACKEVLHNIVKHAGASEVTLSVTADDRECIIIIRDDGRGFTDKPGAVGEDGLLNMTDRLRQIRGSCSRRSSLGEGTTVEFRIPMDWKDD